MEKRYSLEANAAIKAALMAGKTLFVDGEKISLDDFEKIGRCGAYARSTGKPCQRKPVPGKKRCPNHGGLSTGPKTADGKLKSAANGFKKVL